MADDANKTTERQEDDQNLWRAMYTRADGWSEGVAFADHLSVAAPALAEVNGTLYCVHRGARREGQKFLPVRWTSFTPASVRPYVAALEEASKPLPKDATPEQTKKWQAKVQAAADALEAARKWTPDANADDVDSVETPAVVSDNGTLRMVYTAYIYGDGYNTDSAYLREAELQFEDGQPTWAEYGAVPLVESRLAVAPALAVFNGAVHLLYMDLAADEFGHLIRDSDGEWPSPMNDEGDLLAPRELDAEELRREWEESSDGMRGNLSLTAHDGKLHLVYNDRGALVHVQFDGKTWSDETALPDAGSFRAAALASYDGKLHAVYPGYEDDRLRHSTWTQDGGWIKPVALEGHDSNNTPALLTFKEGPEGAKREALLLVHRGIDRYVPPAPPVPPTPSGIKDVVSRGKTVTGRQVIDHGAGAWSRLRHIIALTPATLKDGKTALIVTWEAVAEYYWGFWWYRDKGTENPVGVSGGVLRIKKPSDKNFLRSVDFSRGTFSDGRFQADILITDLEPGTYEVSLLNAYSRKTGGYWWAAHTGGTDYAGRKVSREYYTEIESSKSYATITI